MSVRQQIITSTVCDLCEDEHEGTESFRLAIARGRKARPMPRMVDVCDDWAQRLGQLADRVRKLPAEVTDTEEQPALPLLDPAARKCPLCPWAGKPTGLMTHIIRLHKVQAPRQPRKCPDCPYATDTGPIMVQHRARLHGYVHVDALIAVAEKRKPK